MSATRHTFRDHRSACPDRLHALSHLRESRRKTCNAQPSIARCSALATSPNAGSDADKAMKFLDNGHAEPDAIGQRY
jgi:hypothetical protein